jgi:LuxR family transcriptional regulator, maltose regulon positive regulatory protein
VTRTRAPELSPAVPQLPPATVSRPRLEAYLDAQAELPLTLVGAPAGSGKTVMLAGWAAARNAAWLTLGPRHREVGRLWRDLIAALRATGVDVQIDAPAWGLGEGFALRLADALGAAGARPALVLDDLHLLRGPAVDAIGDLVAYGGNSLRLLVATRADPHLPLQRLRMQGRVGELRTANLAFTSDEAAQLLDGLGLSLRPEQVDRLVSRTEGWAAGLRLAGLSLAGDPDPDAFIAGFTGDDRAIADYLTGEVLATQPPGIREFLLRTSVTDRVCGALADALTSGSHGARTLAELERDGMFLVPLDRHGTWYRYHALFAELLRARLRLEHPELESELHARAAAWLAHEGLVHEAIAHMVATDDPSVLGSLIAEHWIELLLEVHPPEALEAAAEVPGADSRLVVAAASAALCTGDSAAAGARLDGVVLADPEAAAVAALLRARAYDDVEGCRRAASALLGAGDAARALALVHLGGAEFAAGSPDAAGDRLEAAAAIATECGFDGLLIPCLGRTAALELVGGRLERAEAAAHAAIALAEPRGRLTGAAAAWAFATLAAVHWHRDELDQAERRADAAATAAHLRRERQAVVAIRALRAHLVAGRGDADRARAMLRGVPSPPAGSLLARWLEALGPAAWAVGHDGMPASGAADAIAAAAARLAAGDPPAARRRVAQVLEPASGAHGSTRVHACLVDAVARQALGEAEAAGRALERALDSASQDGYRRPFADGGPAVRRLLERHAAGATAHGPLVAELLDGLEPARAAATGLLEPLSDRERAVLRLLPTLLSNTEIAGELFVSVNTVKTHVKSVYRKLDVRSRREAVARARELRLI